MYHAFLDNDKPKVMAKSRTQAALLPVCQRFGLRLPEAGPAVRHPAGIAPSSERVLVVGKKRPVDCERDSSKASGTRMVQWSCLWQLKGPGTLSWPLGQPGREAPCSRAPREGGWKGREVGCLVKWNLTFFNQDGLPATFPL